MNKVEKKPYAKPKISYRGKVDVMSAVCNSAWMAGTVCRIVGWAFCQKTKF